MEIAQKGKKLKEYKGKGRSYFRYKEHRGKGGQGQRDIRAEVTLGLREQGQRGINEKGSSV